MDVWVAPLIKTNCAKGISRAIRREWRLHQISRSGDQENRRLDIFKLLPGHHGRIAEQGSELLMTEKT